MVEAAREAGAEVREQFAVDEFVVREGRVTGVRGREPGAPPVTESALLPVGADGRHSLLARTVGPRGYDQKPALTLAYYTYWEGMSIEGGEIYGRERRMIGVWPTNDGLVMTYVAGPVEEFHAFRSDIEGNMLAAYDLAGDLGERVRAARRADRFYGSANTTNYLRQPYGPGWALVGDAGLAMDPVTGQGISDAFRDAELLADAITSGLAGREPLRLALGGYERARNQAVKPMYDFTTGIVALRPATVEQELLFRALEHNSQQTERFFGVLTGAVPLASFSASLTFAG